MRSLLFFSLLVAVARAQQTSACGQAKIHMGDPVYLNSPAGIVAVELPQGWELDRHKRTKDSPFYFIRSGEAIETTRTLMDVTIEKLEVPFRTAVENDARGFKENCDPSRIEDVPELDILERSCEKKTQMFFCDRKEEGYVDLATKIAIGGSLLNVVLTSENKAGISQYRKDYEFLLKHLAMVK